MTATTPDETLRERIARAINDKIAKLNGWPGRGDKFQHVGAPLADAVLAVLAEPHGDEREALAEAWDEGFNNGYDAVVVEKSMRSSLDLRVNPYRVAALGDAPESGK